MATIAGIRFLSLPGVYHPGRDSILMTEALRAERLCGLEVADVCCGSGLLAIAAARAGGQVTAVDLSPRAVTATRINAAVNRVSVRARRGDLLTGLGRFDVIMSNPPWVPAATGQLPATGPARAWDAGQDGRALIDQIISQAPAHLYPGGILLLLHPAVCDTAATVKALAAAGLDVTVTGRLVAPLTPLLRARARELPATCPWGPDDGTYELSVIRAAR